MDTFDAVTADTVADLSTLTEAFFAAVSFETGARPGYHRLYDLFIDGAQLIKNSGEVPEISSVADFIKPRQAMVDAGELTSFQEFEIADVTEVFGNVAHRFSTYGKRGITNGVETAATGMISSQFVRTPQGWRMSSMAWDDERPGLTIPDRYQPSA